MKSRKTASVLIVAFSIGLGLALVQAQDDPNAPVLDYRQRIMKGHAAAMGSINDYLKFKLDYGPEHVAMHASNISNYAKLIPDAFEKKVTEGKTDAKPVVWENWEDFVAKANALETAGSELAAAAAGGDMRAMMPGVKGVGDACRGCHETYRKPEEERFPR